ncbi:Sodium/solute symporter [Cinara cedri]|uniref:Sodium/solute symporter n=1 Tax=Cinara cedri TaxID=506608 RepID=A0A5E4M5S8_9HEMI|nr:Sodium/solute symporter [Cinara cedri]
MLTLLMTFITLIFVMLVSYQLAIKHQSLTANSYFMASRKLSYAYIAGSMMLTNTSIDQLIGLNGNSYSNNLSSIAWEVTAVIPMVILALFFLPRFMKERFITLPEFISLHYDTVTRRYISILLILTYTFVLSPASLYLGAITINKIFNIQELLDFSYPITISFLIVIIGLIGAAYAIFGGLGAVAISDTINGVFLLFFIFFVPILGLYILGNSSFYQGINIIFHQSPEKLNMIGGVKDTVPFSTIFTGMFMANLFYWCTNQATIQKCMAAKSLEEGQKGVLLTGFFKLTLPIFLMMPGLIAWHIFKNNPIIHSDLAYPQLVTMILPLWMKGFFVAVIIGAVMSHFNAIINASSTLITFDFFKPLFLNITDHYLVRFGKLVSIIVALVSILVAPLLMYAPEGIYMILRRFTGFFNMPVIAIVLYAFFRSNYTSALAAKIVLIFHAFIYGIFILYLNFDKIFNINFIHCMGILFFIELILLEIIGKFFIVKKNNFVENVSKDIILMQWPHVKSVSILLIIFLILLYITFSPFGIANQSMVNGKYFFIILSILLGGLTLVILTESKYYLKCRK